MPSCPLVCYISQQYCCYSTALINSICVLVCRLNFVISLRVSDPDNVDASAITASLDNQLTAAGEMFNISFAPVQRFGECVK